MAIARRPAARARSRLRSGSARESRQAGAPSARRMKRGQAAGRTLGLRRSPGPGLRAGRSGLVVGAAGPAAEDRLLDLLLVPDAAVPGALIFLDGATLAANPAGDRPARGVDQPV